MNIKKDVCVVGAGPAGSTTAKFLSEKGFKVILIDKDKFPRDKPCGGGLPYRALKRFKYIDNQNLIDSYSFGCFVHSSSLKYKIEFHSTEPVVGMTIRKKFDFELVKLAVNNDTVFLDGKTAVNLEILSDKAKIFLNDGSKIYSDIVVGADGVWSIIAKKSGLRKKGSKFGTCILQEFELDQRTLDRFFGEKRFGHIHSRFQGLLGYGWVFPKKKHLNIGIGELVSGQNRSAGKTNLLNIFKNYINILKKDKLIPEKLKIGRCKGGALPFTTLDKTFSDRLILVGDAGGFINSLTGEGIYYGMSSGEIAAEVISKALETEETGEQFLSKYQAEWKKGIGKEINLLYNLARRQRKKPNEKIFIIANNDEKFSELLLGIMTGQLNIQEYKWKIIRRYLYGYIKNLIIK